MAEWIIPCNLKQYDVIGAFKTFDRIEWKQGNKFELGDHIYIYVSNPENSIRYLCTVNKLNIKTRSMKDKEFVLDGSSFLNSAKYMELVKVAEFDTHLLRFHALKENGLKGSMQGPMRIKDPGLASYIYASTTTRLGQIPNAGPDSDHTLREIILILLRAFQCAVPRRYLTNIIYPIGSKKAANLSVPIHQLVADGKITRHQDDTLQINEQDAPKYFFVFRIRPMIRNRKKDI